MKCSRQKLKHTINDQVKVLNDNSLAMLFLALNELPTRLVEVSFFCSVALVMDANFHILPIFAQV